MFEFDKLDFVFNPPLSDTELEFIKNVFIIGQKIKDQDTLKHLVSCVILKPKKVKTQ